MIAMMLVGAALGAVLFTVVVRLAPPRRSTLVELGRYYAHYRGPTNPTAVAGHAAGTPGRIGEWVSRELAARGIHYRGLRPDLALTGQRFEDLMGRKVIAGVVGFLGALLALSAAQYAGLGLPPGAPLAVGALAAVVFFLAPDVDVRKEARRRRAEFREQLSIFLDLVSLQMAGHAAAAMALPKAAETGGGWPMMLIRDTLFRARQSDQNEWDALRELGERIAVSELSELGALVKLVSDDGAQVRQTLTARAASMRRARLADEEAGAEERNQSMRLAHMLIAIGFMLFVGYAAFMNIEL